MIIYFTIILILSDFKLASIEPLLPINLGRKLVKKVVVNMYCTYRIVLYSLPKFVFNEYTALIDSPYNSDVSAAP